MPTNGRRPKKLNLVTGPGRNFFRRARFSETENGCGRAFFSLEPVQSKAEYAVSYYVLVKLLNFVYSLNASAYCASRCLSNAPLSAASLFRVAAFLAFGVG